MIGNVNGGGSNGFDSNVGVIKSYFEKINNLVLNKGENNLHLNKSFKPDEIIGCSIMYGAYIGGQPMLNWNGDYQADYGLAFTLNRNEDKSLCLKIFSSGYYPARDLKVLILYK